MKKFLVIIALFSAFEQAQNANTILTEPQQPTIEELFVDLKNSRDERDQWVYKQLVEIGPLFVQECGILAPERMAQCLLESSVGLKKWSSLAAKYHNFGGVKAVGSKKIKLHTTEQVGNEVVGTYQYFAVNPSQEEGLRAYIAIIELDRYDEARQELGFQHFRSLAKAGYCTLDADDYAKLCMSVLNRFKLDRLREIAPEEGAIEVL